MKGNILVHPVHPLFDLIRFFVFLKFKTRLFLYICVLHFLSVAEFMKRKMGTASNLFCLYNDKGVRPTGSILGGRGSV